MAETLLSPSNILLFGRLLEDLEFKYVDPSSKGPDQKTNPPSRLGDNGFLQKQLESGKTTKKKGDDPRLARIYGFSFEGHYYDLVKPAIFLVHGPGVDANDEKPPARRSRAPSDADRTGTAAQDYTFSEDMKVWSYDKGDFSIRLDIETGCLEEILLETELAAEDPHAYYSGQKVRYSGQKVRYSGQKVRGPGRGGNLGD
jgi:hypothetical protein